MTSSIKKYLPILLAAFLLAAPSAFSAKTVINEGFEKSMPRELRFFGLVGEVDTARARSGKASIRVAPKPKNNWTTMGFDLDGRIDLSQGCEFSLWVYVEKKMTATAYISASDGGPRYTVIDAVGKVEPGKWCQLKGTVPTGDFRKDDQEFRLLFRSTGTCWVDDITLTSGMPDSPAQIWPRLKETTQSKANRRMSAISPGGSLALDATKAVLVPDTAKVESTLPSSATAVIPAEGMLVFAIDAKNDVDLTGSLQLEPDADLGPGLRVTVLADDIVIAAPGVKAAAWKDVRTGDRPGERPDIKGERPSSTVSLTPFRLGKGRHYITIAGPHIRPGGTFAKLELQAAAQPAAKPLYTFGFFSDTHLGFGRPVWMNRKLNVRAGAELEAALRQLKREGADFAILGGDMTDNGRTSQYEDLSRIIKRANIPVYGCLGNHDTFVDSRKKDIAEFIPKLFPNGPENTDYDFAKPPLRFIVLDGSYWHGKDKPIQGHRGGGADQTTYREGMIDWLRETLAKDTATPTIVVSHYQFYLRRGVSDVSGYDLNKGPWMDKKLMVTLDAAPNVVATLNGHLHHNSVSDYHGITSLQNPAFVEWPNAYRVCRVYADRMEWEVRQIPNRGLIREGVVPEKALLWMLSTYDGDLSGTVSLARRQPVTDIVNQGFETAKPPADVLYYRLNREIDTTRARTGKSSLRVNATAEWGTVAFPLDHTMDFNADGEFSIWVYADPGAKPTCYISAQAEGAKDRHTVATGTGKIENGKWCEFKGKVPAAKWKAGDRDIRLIIRSHGQCWIDDATMRAKRP